MKNTYRSCLFSVSVALPLLMAGSALAQTATTDPVGFANITCAAESDSYISVPFTRPPEFVGTIQSVSAVPGPKVNTITVSGTPWSSGQFIYAGTSQPKNYYALIGGGGSANSKEGHTFFVTGNGASTLTVDTNLDDLSGITANTQVTLIPYWTLGSAFPVADMNVSFSPSTSSAQIKTLIRIPDDAASGINSPFLGDYYFSNNVDGTSSNVGWRKIGDASTISHDDDVLLPDSYFVVRNQNQAPALPFTAIGSVLLKKLAVALRTSSTSAQDNPVSILRPLDVTLNMSGLNQTDGSFVANDQLLLFDNAQVGFDKTPATYYRDPATNFSWRKIGNSSADRGNDVIPLGTGFVVRKAQTSTGAAAFWTNSFPVQAFSAVSRKTHGSAGTFDLVLPLTGNSGVEPRAIGSGFQIVVTFPTAVTFTGVSPSLGAATVSGNGTTQATINLTGVPNAKYVTLNLQGVNDGVNVNDVSVGVGFLLGDVNSTRNVDGNDVSAVQARTRQQVNSTTFRFDVNASGSIDGNDVSAVQAKTRTSLQ